MLIMSLAHWRRCHGEMGLSREDAVVGLIGGLFAMTVTVMVSIFEIICGSPRESVNHLV